MNGYDLELEEERSDVQSPDRKLWLNVLFQGLIDTKQARANLQKGNHKSRTGYLADQQSAYWLHTDNFAFVCELAGINPDWLREHTDYGASIPNLPDSILGKNQGPRPSRRKNADEEPVETVMVANGSGPPRKIKADALALPGRFGTEPPEANAPENEAA